MPIRDKYGRFVRAGQVLPPPRRDKKGRFKPAPSKKRPAKKAPRKPTKKPAVKHPKPTVKRPLINIYQSIQEFYTDILSQFGIVFAATNKDGSIDAEVIMMLEWKKGKKKRATDIEAESILGYAIQYLIESQHARKDITVKTYINAIVLFDLPGSGSGDQWRGMRSLETYYYNWSTHLYVLQLAAESISQNVENQGGTITGYKIRMHYSPNGRRPERGKHG